MLNHFMQLQMKDGVSETLALLVNLAIILVKRVINQVYQRIAQNVIIKIYFS